MNTQEAKTLLKNIIEVSENSDECNNVEIDALHQEALEMGIGCIETVEKIPGIIRQFENARDFVLTGQDSVSRGKAEVLSNVIDILKEELLCEEEIENE